MSTYLFGKNDAWQLEIREYWKIYRGTGFLSVVWYGSSPAPSPSFLVSKLSLFLSLLVCRQTSLPTGEGGGEWGWRRSHITVYDGEKAWSSINHSILSDRAYPRSFRKELYLVRHNLSWKYVERKPSLWKHEIEWVWNAVELTLGGIFVWRPTNFHAATFVGGSLNTEQADTDDTPLSPPLPPPPLTPPTPPLSSIFI